MPARAGRRSSGTRRPVINNAGVAGAGSLVDSKIEANGGGAIVNVHSALPWLVGSGDYGVTSPKGDPADVVAASLDRVEAGAAEVLADQTGIWAKSLLTGDPAELAVR